MPERSQDRNRAPGSQQQPSCLPAGSRSAAAASAVDAVAGAGATRHWPIWAWLAVAALIIIVDQITKIYFDGNLAYGERWPLLPFFDFTLLYNPGAAFSFLADGEGWQRWFFTAVAIGAATFIVYLLWRNPRQKLFCAALALILGGAVGNVIDRIQHGHVIDFLLFYWRDWYFPAFNVADIAITCGAILLVLDELLRMRRERRERHGAAS